MAKIIETKEIALSDLEIGFGQVRVSDTGKDLHELADSIRAKGQLQPILVCPASESIGKYEILTGQRRFLAMQELGKDRILACILDTKIDPVEAKVLSLTENMVRLNLTAKDEIDVCTELYHKYGTIKAVAEQTGLPLGRVRNAVKFDQLILPLQELVKDEGLKMETALRAQRAAEAGGGVDTEEGHQDAVELAKEMQSMSGAQQKKIVDDREADPDLSLHDAIEDAKTGSRITQISVTLTTASHHNLIRYADSAGTTTDDAARSLIEDGLSTALSSRDD